MKTQNQTQVNIIEKYFKTGKRVMVEGEIKKQLSKTRQARKRQCFMFPQMKDTSISWAVQTILNP